MTLNRVLELREKQRVKQERIQRNKEMLSNDQELMKNFNAKIEEQCMEAQVKDLTDIKLRAKLKPVKEHLEKWKTKVLEHT